MTPLQWVALVCSIVSLATVAWMAKHMNEQRNVLRMADIIIDSQTAIMRELNDIVSALSSRGALVCDVCGKPIAPMTPTTIDQYEPGLWSIAHDRCSLGVSIRE